MQGVLGALDTAEPGQGRLFNLGNTHPHTVNELVSGLEVALGKPAVRQYFDLPNLGEVLQTHSNISAAAAAFNYSPQVRSPLMHSRPICCNTEHNIIRWVSCLKQIHLHMLRGAVGAVACV